MNASAMEYDGKNKYIRITDIDDENHKFVKSSLTSPNAELNSSDSFLLKEGDILFARTGASVGKTYIYDSNDGKVYYAGFLIRARINASTNPEFIFQNTLTKKYNNFVRITSQRSGQPGINANEYKNYDISLPKIKEQEDISEFLKNMDNLVVLHQRKINIWKTLLKEYINVIILSNKNDTFKVRFYDFEKTWTNNKVGKLTNRFDNLRIPVSSSDRIPGDTPYYGANGVQDYVEGYTHRGEFILLAEDGANNAHDYPVHYVNGKVWVNNHAHVLQGIEGIADNRYLMYALKSINYAPYLVGGSRFKLNADTMMKINIKAPELNEQKKIGEYLTLIDSYINISEKKINKLQNLKKIYLNKMFL